uniref:Uncharacterized protein n=1 Tax=Setaria italica TaxID=4555 RepID=K3YYD4_SETIT
MVKVTIRERMQAVCLQILDCIHNLHEVLSSRISVVICQEFYTQILDYIFALEMQKLLGNDPPGQGPGSTSDQRPLHPLQRRVASVGSVGGTELTRVASAKG